MGDDFLRVLTPSCGLAAGSQSGGEVYERSLLEELPAQGVIPIVGLPSSRALDSIPAGWEVYSVRPGRGLRWYIAPTAFVPWSVKLLRTSRIDLLRAHSARFVAPSLFLARRLTRVARKLPLVVHHHHRDLDWQSRVDMAVLRHADLTVLDSDFVLNDTIAAGVRPELLRVAIPGVAVPSPSSDGPQWLSPPGTRLLFVAHFIERKQPDYVVRAVATLRGMGRETTAIMVGKGPLRSATEQLAMRLGVQDLVQFVDRVSEGAKARLMADADVFAFPSTLEGFGLVAVESQAYGTPVVAGPAAALGEVIVDGETGLLASTQSEFTDAVGRLLGDDALRRAFSDASRAFAGRFTWARTADQVAAAYYDAVARPRHGRPQP